MTLRRQLLLVSLLLLSLPWAGCQFIREMEGALRQGQEQSLLATAQAIATVLGDQQELLYPHPGRRDTPPDNRSPVYAHSTEQPVIIDGYGDGWESIAGRHISGGTNSPLELHYQAQVRGDYLYLLLKVKDAEIVYHNPSLSPEPNGDRLVLRLWRHQRRQDYVIATAAPGRVYAKPGNRRERDIDAARIRGYWQDAVGGYTLELEIPLAYTGGRLGFFLINEIYASGKAVDALGNIKPLDPAAPPWLIYNPVALHTLLYPFSQQGSHILIADREYWQLADLPAAASDTSNTDTFWLLRLIYRSILSQEPLPQPPVASLPGKIAGLEIDAALTGTATSLRYGDANYRARTTLSAAAPIRDKDGVLGAVIVRQSGETYLSLTDKAFSKLLSYSLLALGIGAVGLLGYASLLSWRIGRLSRAARNAIDEDGSVKHHFPRSRAADEIGELSRHYADLLNRVREYNDYLRTLSRKLSHELRTPIAVIQSSLDNLENDQATDSNVYLERAREGLARLQHILTAMSEASHLEESIRHNQAETFDLVPLLAEVFEAYRDVYPEHRLLLVTELQSATMEGVPDLIVQALDKLMENATSFCPPGGEIELQLVADAEHWRLRVQNQGPSLPPELTERLFDPMVSVRTDPSEGVHLGLGLHIVRLIAEFHRGKVRAENTLDFVGVVVTLELPRVDLDANRRKPAA